jgi:hypothetical protein
MALLPKKEEIATEFLHIMFVFVAYSEIPQPNANTVAGLVFYNTAATSIYNSKVRVSKSYGLVAWDLI